ncbi:MAG: RNA polymerase sigma factor [Janthinobacterium lividum]
MTAEWAGLADGELMALCCAGRRAVFAEVMRRHRDRVYRIALASLNEPDDALDVVQETFLAAHRAACRFDQSQPLAPWLAAIALNKVRDVHRRRQVRRWLSLRPPADLPDVEDDEPDVEHMIDARHRHARVMRAMAALPGKLREPLILYAVDGMSQSDVAATLAISEKAVETRVRRARLQLATALNEASS